MSQEAIDKLNTGNHRSDAAHVTIYQVYLNQQSVTVEVHDRGERYDRNLRYHAEAYFSTTPIEDRHVGDERFSIANAEASAALAIDGIHWWKLEAYATRDA